MLKSLYQKVYIKKFYMRYSGLDHSGRYRSKIYEIQVRYGKRNFSVLDKLVWLCICFRHRVFRLP